MSLPPLPPTHYQYSDYWGSNATHYESQHCYEWMLEHVAGYQPHNILDIGCGTGQGITALLKAFNPRIICLEENAACIVRATDKIQSVIDSVEAHVRFHYNIRTDGSHDIALGEGEIVTDSQVTILQGDILLNDPPLMRFLESNAPFDLLTVWLIGSYMYRKDCRSLSGLNIRNGGDYRLRVQNRAYELGDALLRPGGILHIVDRGEPPSVPEKLNDHMNAHKEQASVTSLEVFDVRFRPYTEPTERGVRLVPTPGKSGRIPDTFDLCMISTLARKP